MFESIRKKIEEQNKYNSDKNMSFDFKLMFIYHIAMMVLFGTRIIDNAISQAWFALILGMGLVIVSVAHKIKAKWKWPGLVWFSLPLALLNIIFVYAFLAFASYTMNFGNEVPEISSANILNLITESWTVILKAATVPIFTPWFLAGVGIGVFNILSALKLVNTKKSEFEVQCKNS